MAGLEKSIEDFFGEIFNCAELLLSILNKVEPFCMIKDTNSEVYFVDFKGCDSVISKIDFIKYCKVAGVTIDTYVIAVASESWKVDGVTEQNQAHVHRLFREGRINEWHGAKECITILAQFDEDMYASVSREIDRTFPSFLRIKELCDRDVEVARRNGDDTGNFNQMLPPHHIREKIKPMAIEYLKEAGIVIRPLSEFKSAFLVSEEYLLT